MPDQLTQLNQIELWCKQHARHNTSADGKQHGQKNVYIHHMATKILFISTLILPAYYPIVNTYNLSERLSNSLLKYVKRLPCKLRQKLLVILMQVNNANILNPKRMLYNAITL